MKQKKQFGFSTIELLIIVAIVSLLIVFVATHFASVRQKSRDDTRQTDIANLQFAAESYFAQSGKYPTLAQFNNASFRHNSTPNLPNGSWQDPSWPTKKGNCTANGSAVLVASEAPAVGCYGYVPTPAGCDNKKVICTGYELSAHLEAGGYFIKNSSGAWGSFFWFGPLTELADKLLARL